jgi:undecaprenyl-diphosphatase
MSRLLLTMFDFECRVFHGINRYFDKKYLNLFFRMITHMGSAIFTITITLSLILFTTNEIRITALASALSLFVSHLPVYVVKKIYPRKRPYLILKETKYPVNPLKDHSFPSGHTTAIFALVIPFVLLLPEFFFLLVPIAICVGTSRIYLGLHYPSDVLVGAMLGSCIGVLSFFLLLP